MNVDVNGVCCEQQQPDNKMKPREDVPNGHRMDIDKDSRPSEDIDPKYQAKSFSRNFHKSIKKDLQEAWPMIKSALDQYNILCSLDLARGYMIIVVIMNTDPYIIIRARNLLHLLSIGVPASQALEVLNGKICDVIDVGFKRNGLCSKFGIKKDQYVERRHLLRGSLQAMADLTATQIFLLGEVVAAIGGSSLGLNIFRKIVEDCIVHKVPPAYHIKNFKMRKQVMKDLEAMRL
ncbi:hypothetical protein ACFX2H_033490 [Malus domestica]